MVEYHQPVVSFLPPTRGFERFKRFTNRAHVLLRSLSRRGFQEISYKLTDRSGRSTASLKDPRCAIETGQANKTTTCGAPPAIKRRPGNTGSEAPFPSDV